MPVWIDPRDKASRGPGKTAWMEWDFYHTMLVSDKEDASMTPEQMQLICEGVFGVRGAGGGQEATGGVGAFGDQAIDGKTIFFIAKQGGPIPANLTPRDNAILWDARNHVTTRRGKGEWTGYHAEMIIVSAMLKMLRAGNLWERGGVTDTGGIEGYNRWLGTVIAANAACCKHCHAMLTALGIKRPDPAGPAGLTGWWNPLTDEVYGNGTTEFNKSIPGGTDLVGLPLATFR
jgi:hypothetical protein